MPYYNHLIKNTSYHYKYNGRKDSGETMKVRAQSPEGASSMGRSYPNEGRHYVWHSVDSKEKSHRDQMNEDHCNGSIKGSEASSFYLSRGMVERHLTVKINEREFL